MKKNEGIWIVGYSENDKLPTVIFELIEKAKSLGNKCSENCTAVIIGFNINESINNAFHHGADEVIVVDEENLEKYDANSYSNVLEKLINKYNPNSVLFGADSIGRDLAPRIGVRLETGISADCIDLDMKIENGKNLLIQKKPYLNGEVIVDILCKEKRPQIATVKSGVLPLGKKNPSKTGNIIRERIEIKKTDIFTTILESIPKVVNEIDISNAKIVVAGGRGFKTKKDFDMLYKLAKLIGGVVGATRPLVQDGWISEEYQIGQSGKIIAPNVYISFGISGSAMHTCGVVNPGTWIAVNSDPDASIFKFANYGIIGDSMTVLETLIDSLKNP